MDNTCSTCANHDSKGCRAMLLSPKELFCWADKETQIKREMDIISYTTKSSINEPNRDYSPIINKAKANVRRLQGGA